MTTAEKLVERLGELGRTCGTAESCTGGGIGSAITAVPGSSAVFMGGVISYDNSVKQGVLGVSPETLATVGAVSPETAEQMAVGARKLLKVDYAVSVTGIAGPDGGTAEKPRFRHCLRKKILLHKFGERIRVVPGKGGEIVDE